MLWALDRGNVILITYIFVALAYGPLIKNSKIKAIFAGMAVNMKVYLIGPIFAMLLHRKWVWVEWAILSIFIVYCISYSVFGAGSPVEIYDNITSYADGLVINNPLDIWMASSLLPLVQLTNSDIFPTILILGSKATDIIDIFAPFMMRTGQFLVVMAAIACYLRPEVVPRSRMTMLSISVALFSTEVSAYTEILPILFLFFEPARGFLRKYSIAVAYIICIPLDINIGSVPPLVKETFFFQTTTIVQYNVQLGPFIRPVLMLSISVAMSLLTMVEVYRDIKADGWSTRWRFRRDAPLLPWVRRPVPPAGVPAAPFE